MFQLLGRFAPPPGAASSEVRRTGVRNAFLGLVLFVFGVLLTLSLDRLARGALLDPTHPHPSKLRFIAGLPTVLGFIAMVAGGYRAATGIHPGRDGMSAWSRALRIGFAALLSAVLLAAIVAALIGLATAAANRP